MNRLHVLAGADPGHAGAPCGLCGTPSYPEHFFVKTTIGPEDDVYVCARCVALEAPALAVALEALNLLRTVLADIEPEYVPTIRRLFVKAVEAVGMSSTR